MWAFVQEFVGPMNDEMSQLVFEHMYCESHRKAKKALDRCTARATPKHGFWKGNQLLVF